MFERKGCVRVAVEPGAALDARLERLIDAALEAGAEDFEQHDGEGEGAVEIEVRTPSPSQQDPDAMLASSRARPRPARR